MKSRCCERSRRATRITLTPVGPRRHEAGLRELPGTRSANCIASRWVNVTVGFNRVKTHGYIHLSLRDSTRLLQRVWRIHVRFQKRTGTSSPDTTLTRTHSINPARNRCESPLALPAYPQNLERRDLRCIPTEFLWKNYPSPHRRFVRRSRGHR